LAEKFWYETSISTRMNDLLTNLLNLQALDFADRPEKDAETKRVELRSRVPQPVLGHYDRLIARGKKGVAVVRNQVCTGCHMRLPIGTINTLMQGQDIQLCDTCGRYLCLPEPSEAQPIQEVAPVKPAAKPRKRRAPAHAAA
jgi:predicted  nucleic acid-binding Zn-ribbon protein